MEKITLWTLICKKEGGNKYFKAVTFNLVGTISMS